jgi:hypothetical protein
MNGREISSWGCNSETQADGQITRALFDPVPTRKNCYSDDTTGVVYKKMGLEKRAFFFAKEDRTVQGGSSVAADGGLIEIRVYRSSNRVRRVQEPAVYKCQEEYGLAYVNQANICMYL